MDPDEKLPIVPEPVPPVAPASTPEGYTAEEEEQVRKRLEDLGYL